MSVSAAIEINCIFELSSKNQLPSTYSCIVASITNLSNETLTQVHGNHLPNKTNYDVKFIDNNDKAALNFIPKGMENFFPKISALRFRLCNISRVNANDLDAFDQLTWFALEMNPLEHIPRGFLSQNPKVSVVFFNNNKIKHVGTGLLDSFEDLYYADFISNICINKSVTTATQIPSLIEVLRTNCTDIEDDTTTTTTEIPSTTGSSTEISTTENPTCDNINEVVCNLQEQNEILLEKNLEMNSKIDELTEKNDKITEKLEEIMFEILQLSSRPCG